MTVDYTDFDEMAHQDKLHFFYDEQNRPAKIEFNGTMYTYLHNLQGDIVGIVDNAGTLVVEYKYDAWGDVYKRQTVYRSNMNTIRAGTSPAKSAAT